MSGRMGRIGGPTIAGLAASALVAAVSIGVWAIFPGEGHAACQTDTVGVDTSQATSQNGAYLGEAIGQTFLARDTLLSAITVWRWALEDTDYAGWHLYLARADSLGRPSTLLLDGPTVYNLYGDGVHPTPYRFVFDPPFALPGPGHYEFAIQGYPCDRVPIYLFDNKNDYPDGDMWLHGRTVFSGCRLRAFPEEFPDLDLVFSIEFCNLTTPTLPSTWGAVKDRYRK